MKSAQQPDGTQLFAELCQYVGKHKYGEGYEFNFQMWACYWTIYVTKDTVELTSFSADTPEEVLTLVLNYLKRIKAKKQ